jgi:hypothetical protein
VINKRLELEGFQQCNTIRLVGVRREDMINEVDAKVFAPLRHAKVLPKFLVARDLDRFGFGKEEW